MPTSRPARTGTRADLALAVLRVAVGAVFVAHGWMKAFGFGLPGVTHMLAGMHVPAPEIAAAALTGLEFLGGIALVLGLLTRLLGALFVCDMLGAILLAKLHAGFFSPKGWEFEFTLLVASLALAIGGAGALSIDGAIARRRF
jgi:putative oxidoreductase